MTKCKTIKFKRILFDFITTIILLTALYGIVTVCHNTIMKSKSDHEEVAQNKPTKVFFFSNVTATLTHLYTKTNWPMHLFFTQ